MTQTLEIVRSSLKPGAEEAMLAARQPALDELRSSFPGLLAAYLGRLEDGSYVDVVLWESREHALAAAEHAHELPACKRLFDTLEDDISMEHAQVVHAVADGRG